MGRRAQVIDVTVSYDGPHTAESVCKATDGVATLVRYLANATRQPATLRDAATVDQVLSNLSVAMSGLPQVLAQLGQALDRHAGDPTLYDDRRDRTAEDTARDGADRLAHARTLVWQLVSALDAARDATVHLGNELGNETDAGRADVLADHPSRAGAPTTNVEGSA